MTLHFPDVYSGQAGISFAGAPVAMVKATQGAGYVNPDFTAAKARAAAAGAFLCAYHFLEAGNGAAQAAWCHLMAGTVPLMLDVEQEPSGAQPAVADAVVFIDRYRALGGVVHLLYLPKWYWQRLGSPSLAALIDRGMLLVSSDYTAYSDDGPGWQPYGGMTPTVWQYTSSATFNGVHPVDMNAFKGTLAEFRSLAMTGTKGAPAPAPQWPAGVVLRPGSQGDAVRVLQAALSSSGLRGVRGIAVDGDFGPVTETAVRNFQSLEGLAVDGVAGPATRAALGVQ